MSRYKKTISATLFSMFVALVALPAKAAEINEIKQEKFTPSFHAPVGFMEDALPEDALGPYAKKTLSQYAKLDSRSETTTVIRHSLIPSVALKKLGITSNEFIQLFSILPDKALVESEREAISSYAGDAAARLAIEVVYRAQAGTKLFLVYFKIHDPVSGGGQYTLHGYYEKSNQVYDISIFKHVPKWARDRVSEPATQKEFSDLMGQVLLGKK